MQDPAFGFRQLVDVAIRALSPAVNDPTTAVQAIDRISDLLGVVGNRPQPTGLRVDSAGTVRVKRKLRNFDSLLMLSLTEIIRYGADAPQVVRRLRAMLDELEATLPAGAAGRRRPAAKPSGGRGQRRVARPVPAGGLEPTGRVWAEPANQPVRGLPD